ncbi:MAG TPA: iron-containing redox enzyme family protein [Acidobacteriaceae bacterium]|nr:iron-containing redox enzyme family protein [Acidobacteriaceae bacterium]
MECPTNSDILWGKIRLAEGRLFAATHMFWNHPELPRLFPEFLMQIFCVMRSGLILMPAARNCALALPDDPVASRLASYLEIHIEEEKDHDLWLLDDICTLGYQKRDVLEASPCTATVNLIGAQYFWMHHIHPVAVMGYLILMEGYAPLPAQLQQIQAKSGAPATAFRCLKRHADDDPAHLADLNHTLDTMQLTPEQARAVGMCAFAAIENTSALFEELVARNTASATARNEELRYARA